MSTPWRSGRAIPQLTASFWDGSRMGAPWPTAAPEADDDPERSQDQRHRPGAELQSTAVTNGTGDFDQGDHDPDPPETPPVARGPAARPVPVRPAPVRRLPSRSECRASRYRLGRVPNLGSQTTEPLVSRRRPRAGVWWQHARPWALEITGQPDAGRNVRSSPRFSRSQVGSDRLDADALDACGPGPQADDIVQLGATGGRVASRRPMKRASWPRRWSGVNTRSWENTAYSLPTCWTPAV